MNTSPADLIVERAVRAATSPGAGAVEELIKIAQGRRAPLEAAHTVLVERLRRRPDDFDATRALQLVSARCNKSVTRRLSSRRLLVATARSGRARERARGRSAPLAGVLDGAVTRYLPVAARSPFSPIDEWRHGPTGPPHHSERMPFARGTITRRLPHSATSRDDDRPRKRRPCSNNATLPLIELDRAV